MQLSATLVIFDCDGVLVDSERLAEAVTLAAMREAGGTMTVAEFRDAFLGRTDAEALAAFEAHLGVVLPGDWNARRRLLEEEAFRRELKAVAGVAEAVDALERGGAHTCVASSGPIEKMRVTLGLTGLWHRFETRIFSATEVARGKPAPDLFLHAARRMGFAPEHCLVVEDTRNGVRAARAADMRVVGYTGSTTPAEWLTEATVLIDDMARLPAVAAAL